MNANRWVRCYQPRPQARHRLLCFPFGGGGASVFRTWAPELPANVEVLAVQLPGREERMGEPLITSMPELLRTLVEEVIPALGIAPGELHLFGHSLGARIAFELARELRRRKLPGPKHLFVSGRSAPHLPPLKGLLHTLPEPEFIEAVRELGGTPAAFFDEPELVRLFLAILRADFTINETSFEADEPLDCPMTAFGGTQDPFVPEHRLSAWREHTTGPFEHHLFPGDHFFLVNGRKHLLEQVARRLTP